MSKVIYKTKDEVNSDLIAAVNLSTSAAYCYLEDIESSAKHFKMVLDDFYQLKLHHAGFTVCADSLLEVAIILYRYNKLTVKEVKKILKSNKIHARFVKRSGPLVKLYKHIYKNGHPDIMVCKKLLQESDRLGTFHNSQLIRAHVKHASDGEEHLDGMFDVSCSMTDKKIAIFWKLLRGADLANKITS